MVLGPDCLSKECDKLVVGGLSTSVESRRTMVVPSILVSLTPFELSELGP